MTAGPHAHRMLFPSAVTPVSSSVSITMEAAAWQFPFSRSGLRAAMSAMLREAGCPDAALEITVTGDAAMEALNESAMGCAGPTNILSFPAGGFQAAMGAGVPIHLGCMVFSAETLTRECLLYGQEPEEHALRLLAHGLAHVLGFDHGKEMDALAERLERAAARNIG